MNLSMGRCRTLASWLLCWLACLLCLACTHGSTARAEQLSIAVAVGDAQAATRPSQVNFEAGTPVALPDDWLRTRADGSTTVVWYAVNLDAALAKLRQEAQEGQKGQGAKQPSTDWVAVVPRAANQGEFWLNGERLELGIDAGSARATRNRTLWLELPESALLPTGNTLQVRIQGVALTRSGLSAITLGAPADLWTSYQVKRFFQTTIPSTLTVALVATLIGAASLWLKTRQRAHAMFLMLSISWLLRALVVTNPTAGTPSLADLLALLVSSMLGSLTVVLLMLDFLDLKGRFWRNCVRFTWVSLAAAIAIGLAAAANGQLTPKLIAMLHWPFLGVAQIVLVMHVRKAFLQPSAAQILIAFSLVVGGIAGVNDLAQVNALTAFDSIFWSPTANLLMLLAIIWRTVQRLALVRGRADHEVQQAVGRAASEHGQQLEQLQTEFDRIKTAERNSVIAAERSRLLHDLHDGMGSQLITALRMTRRAEVPREDVARVIEDSLDDMRLIIDSLDVEERDLLPLLGNLRYRLEPRLNAIGLALVWDVEPLPELEYLSPETALAIVRIVQEAVNNAVRHGAATTLTVSVRTLPGTVELVVADDGTGFDVEHHSAKGPAHRGLGAMHARAKKLAGQLSVISSEKGTQVRLALPLASAPAMN
jgi:signal transduction histidine kinase